jgi:hypothetical protein
MPNTKGSRQTRKQFAQAPPRLLPAGVSRWLRADYLTSNPDDTAAIIHRLADDKRPFGTEDAPGPVYQSMQSVVNFAVESKLIDNAPSVDSLLDPPLIRDAR